MILALLIEVAWKSALLAGFILALLWLLRSRSAAERALIAGLGLAALMVLPLAMLALPEMRLGVAATILEALPPQAGDAVPPPDAQIAPTRAIDAESALILAYALFASALMLLLAADVARLRRVRTRAHPLRDARWLAALKAARKRFGLERNVSLLVSDELASPVSWGVARPVVAIDRLSADDAHRADAVLTHELAHVAHFDWPMLLIARAATAVYWFNPLVRMLAQTSRRLCEQSADDCVLRSTIDEADYAELLVESVRFANGRALLAANGVAVSRAEISDRVAHLLDSRRSRRSASRSWRVACLLVVLGVCAPVATLEVVPKRVMAQTPGAGAGLGRIATAPRTGSAAPDWPELPALTTTVPQSRSSGSPAANDTPRTPSDEPNERVRRRELGTERAARGARWAERGAAWSQRGNEWRERGAAWSQRGNEWRERGAAWSQRGDEWRERGSLYSQRGDRLSELGAARSAGLGSVSEVPSVN